MFKRIETINDLQPFVAHKQEIRFYKQPNGITMSLYMFMDSKTFDSPEAIECRGSAFDEEGKIVSRPLHKFFNMGEKDYLSPDKLRDREENGEVVGVYEKLDGSMIATAWVNGELAWRSKKSFHSDVVRLTNEFLDNHTHRNVAPSIKEFAHWCASHGMTAIFELTHPEAQIVVPQDMPRLRLLHVRDNVTGTYVLLNRNHPIHEMIKTFDIPRVNKVDLTLQELFDSLENMQNMEGYVVQFSNGDMVKIKCGWYSRLHRSITFLRERDIATLSINEELDDMKRHMTEVGIDLAKVEEVEGRLKAILAGLASEVEETAKLGSELSRKEFALMHNKNPLFGLIMKCYLGEEVDYLTWYSKNRLKDDFSLKSLLEGAQAEAVEG